MASNTSSSKINRPKKTKKSMRRVSENIYGELKKNASYSLTPTAIEGFKEISQDLGTNTSDLLEQIYRLGPILIELLQHQKEAKKPSDNAL